MGVILDDPWDNEGYDARRLADGKASSRARS